MAISDCLPISIEQIRARIIINDYVVETPFVKNFNVIKSRGSASNSFSATVEIPVNASMGSLNGNIVIYAGTKQVYFTRKIFTGTIRTVTATPSPGKPNYMLLNLAGNDIMYKLENKKFSRRIPTDGPGVYVTITGSSGARQVGVWTTDKSSRTGRTTYTSYTPKPESKGGDAPKRAPALITTNPGQVGTQGLGIHAHDSQNSGGSSFARYAPRIVLPT